MTFEEWYESENKRDEWEWRLTDGHLSLDETQFYWVREACRRAAMAAWHDGRTEGRKVGYKAGVRDEHEFLKAEQASGYVEARATGPVVADADQPELMYKLADHVVTSLRAVGSILRRADVDVDAPIPYQVTS